MKKILASVAVILIILAFSGCKQGIVPVVERVINQLPVMLNLDGPSTVIKGQAYEFVSLGEDPDGDQLSYHFGTWYGDQYDETYRDLGWTPFGENRAEGKRMITWTRVGEHTVCSYCRDKNGGESHIHLLFTVFVTE